MSASRLHSLPTIGIKFGDRKKHWHFVPRKASPVKFCIFSAHFGNACARFWFQHTRTLVPLQSGLKATRVSIALTTRRRFLKHDKHTSAHDKHTSAHEKHTSAHGKHTSAHAPQARFLKILQAFSTMDVTVQVRNGEIFPKLSEYLRFQNRLGIFEPVSSEISDLLLFVSYFASQSKGMKFGYYFFDVYCVNQNFLIRCQIPTTSHCTGIPITTEKYWTLS